jgi:hypothetical protein
MSRVLTGYFREVISSDAYQYGYGGIRDFIGEPYRTGSYD